MGQFRQTHREITIAGGAATGRTWDAPSSMPFTNVSIALSSFGTLTTAANISFQVFIGGHWVGTGASPQPFVYGSTTTHAGGVSQAALAPLTAATEIAQVIYTSTAVFPANAYQVSKASNPGLFGFPIVVELTNNNVAAITLNVTFTSETIGTNV